MNYWMEAVNTAAIDTAKIPASILKMMEAGVSTNTDEAFGWLHGRVMKRLSDLDRVALDSDRSKVDREGARENIKAIEASVASLMRWREGLKTTAGAE